ncbi:MAG: hypothetical protein M1324_04515 [Patescibacteria group bacterium]|nr:hypothetical protein [Patescibacteria group bacterium]
MKKEIKKKLKNFTHEIIDLFLGVPESFIYAFDRKEFYRVLQGVPSEKVLTCSNICKILNNLKQQGYIEVEKLPNGNESIVFTNKAKLAIVDRIAGKTLSAREYCLVSFDIPERMKNNRDRFRQALKRMRFHQIQKSLWVSNKKLGDLVELASVEYQVNEYVVYFISSNSNINSHIDQLLKRNDN